MKYYLAYGPNLNLVQMRQRCPNARVVGYTYLFGVRLVFRGSKNGCFLTTDFQQPWCPSMVGCGVYEISDKDEQALDVYAGVPYFYQKQTTQVQCVWDVTTRREVLHNIEAILYTLPASHPLGVPSRMNVGQLLENHLGWAAKWGWSDDPESTEPVAGPQYVATPVFDGFV